MSMTLKVTLGRGALAVTVGTVAAFDGETLVGVQPISAGTHVAFLTVYGHRGAGAHGERLLRFEYAADGLHAPTAIHLASPIVFAADAIHGDLFAPVEAVTAHGAAAL